MINARSETASTKPAFRDALKSRRCLIPADGFYEWSRTGKAKQPYCFEVNDGELFAFAGLWDRWKDEGGTWLETCSILTTTPNAVTSAVHDRMPVNLDPDCYDLWLDPGMKDGATASEMLKPYDARLMRCYPVSSRVNSVVNDDEACSAPWNPLRFSIGSSRSAADFLLSANQTGFGGCSIRPSLDLNQPHASNRLCEHCQFQIQG